MTKLKYIIIFTVALAVVFLVISADQQRAAPQETGETPNEPSAQRAFIDPETGIRLTFLPYVKPEYHFSSQQKQTFKAVAAENNWTIAINGGYFLGSYTQATHAGLLHNKGNNIANLAPADKQLSHIAEFSATGMQFSLASEFSTANLNSDNVYVQLGPLFISDTQALPNFIDQSANGKGAYKRSFIVMNHSDNEIVIGIASKPINLHDLASFLIHFPRFSGKRISAINLDGGQSSAIYSQLDPQLNYNINWFLPAIIGFRRAN